jgi:uncharacterized protein YbaP (TraB family)
MTVRKQFFTAIVGAFLSCVWVVGVSAQPMAEAQQAAPAFWKVEGEHNTLWLLGSVHVLTKDHYPMAAKVEKAFAESPVLVVEADVLNTDPAAMQQAVARTGSLPAGQSLQSVLGPDRFKKASQLAMARGYDLSQMQNMRPWLLAMMITVNEFAKLGYTADQGVDVYFLRRAGDKSIVELESLEQQLQLFASMNPETEANQLLHTLEQMANAEDYVTDLVNAWESGDLESMEAALTEEFADYPELYDALIVKRNTDWLRTFGPILKDSKQDHFVTVGALHLVGEHSVVDLLRKQGYKVTPQ